MVSSLAVVDARKLIAVKRGVMIKFEEGPWLAGGMNQGICTENGLSTVEKSVAFLIKRRAARSRGNDIIVSFPLAHTKVVDR
jgi:hypothetical protein